MSNPDAHSLADFVESMRDAAAGSPDTVAWQAEQDRQSDFADALQRALTRSPATTDGETP